MDLTAGMADSGLASQLDALLQQLASSSWAEESAHAAIDRAAGVRQSASAWQPDGQTAMELGALRR